MARLARVTQKIFASTPGLNQVAQFGSLDAATPTFTTDIAVIQALSNYAVGWFNAVEADYSPAIEDMNSLFLLATTQLAYGLQAGIPEWDAGTTYYTGNLVQVPVVVFTVTSANATVGATYTNNAFTFTVQSTIAASTSLTCTYTGQPLTSGTLTKATGTGDSTITFSAAIVSTGVWVSTVDTNLAQAVTSTASWRPYMPSLGVANALLMTNSTGNGMTQALLTNSNVAAAAAIAGTKISPAFGSQNVSWTGTLTATGAPTFTANTGQLVAASGNAQWNVTAFSSGAGSTSTMALGYLGSIYAGGMSYANDTGVLSLNSNGTVNALTLTAVSGIARLVLVNAATRSQMQIGTYVTITSDTVSGDMFVGVNGAAGTGPSTSSFHLAANGNVFFSGLANASTANAVFYNTGTGSLSYATSSKRDKKNIRDSEISSDVIYKLPPLSTFERKSTNDTEIGRIAEDIIPIEPRLVGYNTQGEAVGVYYQWIHDLAVEEVKKHEARLKRIEAALGL